MFKDKWYGRVFYMADDGGAGTGSDGNNGAAAGGNGDQGAAGGEGEKPAEKTFTQAELDKIVSERVARERKTIESQVEKAKAEAEALAKMTAEEQAKHKQKEAIKALQAREAEITKRELRATGMEELGKRNLPADLIGLLKLDSVEALNESLASTEKAFLAAVQNGVESRLKGSTPKDKGPAGDDMAAFRAAMGLK